MCAQEICGCKPVYTKGEPRVHVVIDRRMRPNVPVIGGRRNYDLSLDQILDGEEQTQASS